MNSDRKLLFCNVDFDTDLASWRSPRQQQSCLEAQFYYLLCGSADDRIILDAIPNEDHIKYLSELGIVLPRRYSEEEVLSECTAFPWGWSASAVNRFIRCGATVHHPHLESVQTVNSRRFCHRVAQRHGLGIPGAELCESADKAISWICTSRSFPLVVKPEHGNAGIGFIHLPSPNGADDGKVARLFSRPGTTAVVGPWVNRVADISTRLYLESSGHVDCLVHHKTLNNRAGVYVGNLLGPEDPLIDKWRYRLDTGALNAAQELHTCGYFGPAGLDWVVYKQTDTGEESCALVDINARQPMSFVAYSLRERLADGKYCLFLFAPRRRYPTLTDYESWHRRCGENAFDAARATGILLFTPLSYTVGQTEYRPLRHGFFIAGNTREEMLFYDRHLRNAFKSDGTQ